MKIERPVLGCEKLRCCRQLQLLTATNSGSHFEEENNPEPPYNWSSMCSLPVASWSGFSQARSLGSC